MNDVGQKARKVTTKELELMKTLIYPKSLQGGKEMKYT